MTDDDVATFARCMSVGGVALFPADTVYGLATEPDSDDGVYRIYAMKRRPPERPSAVMFFDIDLALHALPELLPATRDAVIRLLPGPVTVLLPNPATRFPLACGAEPSRLGLRVPKLDAKLHHLADVKVPVLQSSANPTGDPDAKSLEEVDARIRRGADIELDAGVLPGTPSTVIDLSSYEESGTFEVLREGALTAEAVGAAL